MARKQAASTPAPVRPMERITLDPCFEGFAVTPTRYHEDLIFLIGLKDLHGDEPGKILHVTAAFGEAVYDLVCRAFFHGEAVEDRDHSYLRTSSGRLRCRCRRRVLPS